MATNYNAKNYMIGATVGYARLTILLQQLFPSGNNVTYSGNFTPVPVIEYCANQDAYKVYSADGRTYEYVPASEINVIFKP
jgi:hypothetical protein